MLYSYGLDEYRVIKYAVMLTQGKKIEKQTCRISSALKMRPIKTIKIRIYKHC